MRETIDLNDLSKRAFNAPVPGVIVRELLCISPDLIPQLFGAKRVPPISKQQDKPDANAYTIGWKEALRKLYACASPKCKGRIEDTEYEMLIVSGAELCLMSKYVYDELELPIDLDVDWSVGAAKFPED